MKKDKMEKTETPNGTLAHACRRTLSRMGVGSAAQVAQMMDEPKERVRHALQHDAHYSPQQGIRMILSTQNKRQVRLFVFNASLRTEG